MTAFLQRHPEWVSLVPALLDRGDPLGRALALQISIATKPPELLAALRDFALGQRGPDSLRMRAAQVAVEGRLIPPGAIRFWVQGNGERSCSSVGK
jgi:hypothetical protein